MREAQALMTPVMLILMIPWILWLPISRDPNSMFAIVAELRPAAQQLRDAAADDVDRRRRRCGRRWLAIVVGAAGAYAAAVVRGQGLPHRPADVRQAADFGTLVRWARMG